MKPRGVVVLAIVAVAMAAIIAIERWAPRRRRRSRGRADAALLPPFDRQAVKRVTIARKGGAFSLLHSPSPSAPPPAPGWHLGVDGAPAADDAAVQDLLSALDLAESDRTAQLAPEQAGLVAAGRRGRRRDADRHAGAAARLARCDRAGRLRARGRQRADPRDRPPRARPRRSRTGGVPRPAAVPAGRPAVTAIAWRDEKGARARAARGRRALAERAQGMGRRPSAWWRALRRLLALRIDRVRAEPPADTRAGGPHAGADGGRSAHRGRGGRARRRSCAAAEARDRSARTTLAVGVAGAGRGGRRATLASLSMPPDDRHAHRSPRRPRSRRPPSRRRRLDVFAARAAVRGRHARRRRMAGAAGSGQGGDPIGRRQRAPPARRGALPPADRRCRPRPTSMRCSRPIRCASARATVLSFARFDVRRLQRSAGSAGKGHAGG